MDIQHILSSSAFNWIGIAGLAFAGIFAIVGLFSKKNNEKEEKAEKESDRLIGILQGTVDQLEKKLTIQTDALNNTMRRLQALETENTVYKEIFQGRDEQMQKFMKDGFEVMGVVPDMLRMMKATNENVEKLYQQLITQNKTLVEVASKN